jgi:hypothetical protein
MIGSPTCSTRGIAGKRIGNAPREITRICLQESAREQAQDHFHTDCFGGASFDKEINHS